MTKDANLILIGAISAASGIKGDIIVKSYTKNAIGIAQFPIIDSQGNKIILKIIRKNAKGHLICKIDGCNDRNKAEELKGIKLYCLKENLPNLQENEFYIEDLRKLKVLNKNKEEIGIVQDVVNFGAGDIIEIKFHNDNSEMFPFTKEFFPEVKKDHIILDKN